MFHPLELLILLLGTVGFLALLAGCLLVAICLLGRADLRRPSPKAAHLADPGRIELFPWD